MEYRRGMNVAGKHRALAGICEEAPRMGRGCPDNAVDHRCDGDERLRERGLTRQQRNPAEHSPVIANPARETPLEFRNEGQVKHVKDPPENRQDGGETRTANSEE